MFLLLHPLPRCRMHRGSDKAGVGLARPTRGLDASASYLPVVGHVASFDLMAFMPACPKKHSMAFTGYGPGIVASDMGLPPCY